MAYGFETFNANGDKLIDSGATSMIQIASVETWTDTETKTRADNEIFLVNFDNSGGSGTVWIQFATVGTNNDGYRFTNGSSGSLSLARAVEVASDPSPPASSDYGLEIYNSGSTTIYNGNYTKSFDIVDWHAKGDITGETTTTGTGSNSKLNSNAAGTDLYFTLPRPVKKTYGGGDFVIRENQFNIDTNNDIILIAYTEAIGFKTFRQNGSAMFTAQIRN